MEQLAARVGKREWTAEERRVEKHWEDTLVLLGFPAEKIDEARACLKFLMLTGASDRVPGLHVSLE